jgi:hypothetical protein
MKKLLILAALSASAATQAAPVQWANNGHWYEFIGSGTTWTAALAAAAGAGPIDGYAAHLATVTSADENAFIKASVTNQTAWIAGTDVAGEGVWSWAAGPEEGLVFWNNGVVPGVFQFWNPGEPNNVGNEDCLHMNFGNGGWNDVPCSSGYGYLIEWSKVDVPGGVPEPTTWAMLITGLGGVGAVVRRRRRLMAA